MLKLNQLVHVDTDNEEWGRLASDGKILDVFGSEALVEVYNIRANILVPYEDITIK